jgi:hypothetical protein
MARWRKGISMSHQETMSMTGERPASGSRMAQDGHLYMQTNEVRNCVIHYQRDAGGTITEVGRITTGGAGSGTYKPVSGQESAPNGVTPGTYPVGLGILFAELGSPEEDAFAVHQYGVAMTMLSAALRLMRIDHRQVQAILFAADRGVGADYAAVRAASLPDMAGFTPMADILAAVHVRSHVRLFMN